MEYYYSAETVKQQAVTVELEGMKVTVTWVKPTLYTVVSEDGRLNGVWTTCKYRGKGVRKYEDVMTKAIKAWINANKQEPKRDEIAAMDAKYAEVVAWEKQFGEEIAVAQAAEDSDVMEEPVVCDPVQEPCSCGVCGDDLEPGFLDEVEIDYVPAETGQTVAKNGALEYCTSCRKEKPRGGFEFTRRLGLPYRMVCGDCDAGLRGGKCV